MEDTTRLGKRQQEIYDRLAGSGLGGAIMLDVQEALAGAPDDTKAVEMLLDAHSQLVVARNRILSACHWARREKEDKAKAATA